ncbi:MAG: hypothetical protein FWG64_13980 [Firmicutes bacterium]|nr:hypothetical protein [Bacillota bacterium]
MAYSFTTMNLLEKGQCYFLNLLSAFLISIHSSSSLVKFSELNIVSKLDNSRINKLWNEDSEMRLINFLDELAKTGKFLYQESAQTSTSQQ